MRLVSNTIVCCKDAALARPVAAPQGARARTAAKPRARNRRVAADLVTGNSMTPPTDEARADGARQHTALDPAPTAGTTKSRVNRQDVANGTRRGISRSSISLMF